MYYISVRKAAELWNVPDRWIQKLCEESSIDSKKKGGESYVQPSA